MSEQARNFRVGVFVVLGVLAMGTCAVVLGGEGLFAPRVRFESYFDESVTGLEVGSPVRYRGVRIGVVKSIGLVENYYEFESDEKRLEYGQRVSILMELVIRREEDADLRDLSYEEHRQRLQEMVELGLRLRITQSGITGISFIQADILDPKDNPPMKITWEPRHIYIPSAPSTIATLTSAVERFALMMENVDIVELADDLDTLLKNLGNATTDLDLGDVQLEMALVLTELRETNAFVRGQIAEMDLPGIGERTQEAIEGATAAVTRAQRMLDGGRYDLEMTLENMRVATENLRDLTETLKSQPSLLLRGEPPKSHTVEVGP
jgi:paraquat-inducible protein B